MIGADFIADTNVIISIKEGRANSSEIIIYKFAISVITEIELLGWKDISKFDKKIYQAMIKNCILIPLENDIKNYCIKLKQQYNIKTPDAIIASTSMVTGLPLISGDKNFSKIKSLKLILI
jgi:predicted nucleic acid-binding protein